MDTNPPFEYCISNSNTDINIQLTKPAQFHFHFKKPHTTTKNRINIDSTIQKKIPCMLVINSQLARKVQCVD